MQKNKKNLIVLALILPLLFGFLSLPQSASAYYTTWTDCGGNNCQNLDYYMDQNGSFNNNWQNNYGNYWYNYYNSGYNSGYNYYNYSASQLPYYQNNQNYSNQNLVGTSKSQIPITASSSTKKISSSTTVKTSAKIKPTETGKQVGQLVGGALFGYNSFMPSSLIQWIFFFILILLGVILWRRLYVSEEKKNLPLKHA